ncbi:MAG TPA: hypothetical protein VNH17_04035, partial [Streptosporangiaceae bacterium]|nr:hypothetical protein [Streptosporangiaceae bacterium]
ESHPYRRITEPSLAIDEALRLDEQQRAILGRRQPSFTAVRATGPIPGLWKRPAPPASRAQAFIADKRTLPAFAATTKAAGWQGLHMSSRPATHERWTTERWLNQAMHAIAVAADAAMAEIDEQIGAARARVAAGERHDPVMPFPARRDGWLREALAEATWGAYRWYAGRDEGKALIYEGLHDAVVSAADDASALTAVRASIADSMADADDLTGPSGLLAGPLAADGAR